MTAKRIIGSIAVALALSASCGRGATATSDLWGPLGAASVGQAPAASARPAEKQGQADDLVRRARQAMAENDLNAAQALVGQAEALNVQYGPFHFGDTPAKVRRDLERARAASATQTRPSQMFNPQNSAAKAAAANPFAQAGGAAVPASAKAASQGVTRLPNVDQPPVAIDAPPGGAMPRQDFSQSPFGRSNTITMPPSGAEDQVPGMLTRGPAPAANADVAASNQALLSARRALALGDLRRATGLLEQAKAMPVQRGMYDDTPENVESLVRRYNDLMALPPDRRTSEGFRREYARLAMEQAEGLLRRGDLDEAERLAHQAGRQQVMFGPMDAKPENLLQRISAARRQGGTLPGMQPPAAGAVVPAGAVLPAGGAAGSDGRANRALYDPAADPTRNVLAANLQPAAPPPGSNLPNAPNPAIPGMGAAGPMPPMPTPSALPGPGGDAGVNPGMMYFEQGEAALKAHDPERALQMFRQALPYRNQMDPLTVQRMQDHLQLLAVSQANQRRAAAGPADEAAMRQQVLARQIEADIIQEESTAKAMVANDPKKALGMLEQTRQKVSATTLDPATKEQLLRRVDRSLAEMRKFVDDNRPRIELEEKNQRIRDDVDRQRKTRTDSQEKLAQLINDYNRLMDDQRYAEAEVLAKRAVELDPQNPVAHQILQQSKFVRRFTNSTAIASAKEQGFADAMESVDLASKPFDDRTPMVFGDAKEWKSLSNRRRNWLADRQRRRSDRELEIEQKLKTPVSLQFEAMPLSKVVEHLGKLAGVSMHLDPQGLTEEGVTTDTPVTIKLEHEISLKSALNLILQPLHLNFVIKDEVLKVTSERIRGGQIYTVTYNVADLVVSVPNFVPNSRMGIEQNLHDAYTRLGMGGNNNPFGHPSVAVVATPDGKQSASGAINPAVLAQVSRGSNSPTTGATPGTTPMGFGPGNGVQGGTGADFDALIELIQTTVKPQSWQETAGGSGTIKGFETNLSLVVSQTQDVHEEIVDLLEQLRRLQDLQVTIEVRFISLNDNFFERIGVDFDFDLNSNVDRPYQIFGRSDPATSTTYTASPFNTNTGVPRDVTDRNLHGSSSATVGLEGPGVFSADLDIPFRQGSFDLATPQFGGFDPLTNAGASIGFAILSDIEAYFFVQAAQGDSRSNVLQAPKVTLFNGQQAFVSDTSQTPFVISVIPVVGDFAAAQQPVIVVLSEGTFLTVQAVISNDRRFVRLTVVPFFSKIGDVHTFTFTGRETTVDNTSEEGVQDKPNDNTKKNAQKSTSREGTTVQLPTFSFITVTTTVSVPDGGTVLLGGIKRLSEGRREFGTPILNKIPYINRLFKNVGVGRDSQSLMMMVTPRIIIQEEEEERLGIQP